MSFNEIAQSTLDFLDTMPEQYLLKIAVVSYYCYYFSFFYERLLCRNQLINDMLKIMRFFTFIK